MLSTVLASTAHTPSAGALAVIYAIALIAAVLGAADSIYRKTWPMLLLFVAVAMFALADLWTQLAR